MSSPPSRLKNILGHLGLSSPAPKPEEPKAAFHIHQLSPTYFLERAAAIEPDAEAIVHIISEEAWLPARWYPGAEHAGFSREHLRHCIFDYAEVDSIIVDQEFLHLLDEFKQSHPSVPFIIDTDTDAIEGELSGPFDEAILEGLQFDQRQGNKRFDGLQSHCGNDDDMLAIPFTSGTTSRPKV